MSVPFIDIPEKFNMASKVMDTPIQMGLGHKTAIFYEKQTFTYNDVFAAVNKTGNILTKLGVLREQRVLLLLPDSPEFIFNIIGAMKIGAVPVPLNTMLKPKDYLYFLNDSRAVVLVVGQDLLPVVEEILPQALYLKEVLVVGEKTNEKYLNYYHLMAEASADLEAAETSKDDAAFWLYSSGTTGQPKGAVHLHHDMVYAATYFDSAVTNLTSADRIFSVSKLFFSYGNVNSLYLPFLAGAAIILHPGRPEPETVLEMIAKYQPTVVFGVPTSYSSILRVFEEGRGTYDLSSVRMFLSAGENLPPIIWKNWKDRFGLEIYDAIGSTEAGYIYISNLPGECRPGSSGKVVPGYEIKIVDESDHLVPPGQPGNLLVKGDSIAAGYWNKHDKSRQAFIGEWYVSGDQFTVDEEGYFWYIGRSDDMIKVGGIWVSPIEVETILMEHPSVQECAVTGQMDANGLLKTAAFVVLRQGAQGTAELTAIIREHVKAKTASYKVPRWVHFLPELPKTASGKTQRFKLREMAGK